MARRQGPRALHASVVKALAAAAPHTGAKQHQALAAMLLDCLGIGDWDAIAVVPGRRDRAGRVHADRPKIDEGTLWLLPVLTAYAKAHPHPFWPDAPLALAARIERGRADADIGVPAALRARYAAALATCRRAALAALAETTSASDAQFMRRASVLADLLGCPDAGRACESSLLSHAGIVDDASERDVEIVARTGVTPVRGFEHVVTFSGDGNGNVVRFPIGSDGGSNEVVATFAHPRDARFVYALDIDGNVVRRRPGGARASTRDRMGSN